MSNAISSNQHLNVKHVATLFEEVQHRYVKKLTSIDERSISTDERHKVKNFEWMRNEDLCGVENGVLLREINSHLTTLNKQKNIKGFLFKE